MFSIVFNLAVSLLVAFVMIRDLKYIQRKAVSVGLYLGFCVLAVGLNTYHRAYHLKNKV